MASKTVKLATDWSKLMSEINNMSKPALTKFKGRCDANAVKLSSLPESLPKIDWAYYKANASNPKLVEEIQKQYETMKIQTPKAPASRVQDLETAQQQDMERLKRYTEIAKTYIESADVVKEKFEKMIPFHEMSLEDWSLTFPYWSKSIDNPSVDFYGRVPGLSREEQIAFEQPDPLPFSTPTAWKDWEKRKAKYYSN